jgi:hypothetical protein
MKTAPGKQRLTHTPFLDGWRPLFLAATEARGSRADLARFLTTQGRRTIRSNHNLITRLRAGSIVPNAEDFLATSHWMANRTATPKKRTL